MADAKDVAIEKAGKWLQQEMDPQAAVVCLVLTPQPDSTVNVKCSIRDQAWSPEGRKILKDCIKSAIASFSVGVGGGSDIKINEEIEIEQKTDPRA